MKKILKSILLVFSLAVCGYLLMSLCYAIPTDGPIYNNAKKTADQLSNEGEYQMLMGIWNSSFDNFETSIMLQEAISKTNENPFTASLLCKYHDSNKPKEDFQNIFKDNNYNEDYFNKTYARYWHGYVIILKPLLLIESLFNIRYFLMISELCLVFYLVISIAKNKKNNYLTWPIILTYIFLNPVILMLGFDFWICITITLISSIIILKLKNKNNLFYLFVVTGALTCFFDFFTYPLVTFGLPITLYLFMNKNKSVSKTLKTFIFMFIVWAFAYLFMWSLKWIFATIITGQNVFADAYDALCFRTGLSNNPEETKLSDNKLIAFMQALKLIMICSLNNVLYLVFAAILIMTIIISAKDKLIDKSLLSLVFACILIVLIWCLAITNHTYIHARFVFRILSIPFFATLSYCFYVFSKSSSISNLKNKLKGR